MTKAFRFLHLEDSPEDADLLRETLAREYIPAEVTWVCDREALLAALQAGWVYDLVFADFALPGFDGEEALSLVRAVCPYLPFIIVSGALGEERAVECLRKGATDYVMKTNLSRLAPVTRRALEEAREARGRREAEAASMRMAGLLRAALESTTEGVLVADLAGRVSAYNRKFLTLCGIPDFVMAPMELDRVLQFLANQCQGVRPLFETVGDLNLQAAGGTFHLMGPSGERLIEEACRPQIAGEKVVGHVFSFRDVTAREQAMARLQKRIAELEQQLARTHPERGAP